MTMQVNTRRRSWRRIADSRLLNALAAPNGMGRYLEALNPMWALDQDRLPAKVIAVRHPTADSVSVAVRTNGEWLNYRAGQFIQVFVRIDGRQYSRSYSLSRAPESGVLQITVKAQDQGLVSQYLNSSIAPGDIIYISQAQGDFILPIQLPKAMLLIAAGSGITPIFAMLESLFAQDYRGGITLLYYNRSRASSIFRNELQDLAKRHPNFSLLEVFSQSELNPDEDIPGQHSACIGHFSENHLLHALTINNTLSQHTAAIMLPQTYVCGPAQLIDSVTSQYQSMSHADKLHSERFGLAIPAANKDSVGGKIQFSRSGVLISSDGRTLLEQAEASGLQAQHGCRMGICHRCSCQKTSGSVRNISSGEISHGEEYIRLCISQPIGPVELTL
jgi:ferredoxin-NADP reductase